MNSEDYFKSNLQRFKKKICELQNKYPSLSSTLNIDKDPHIEHMITSFAFLGSNLQYQQDKKINRETKSIIRNFPSSYFNPSPPMAVFKLLAEEATEVKSQSKINCSGSTFKNLYHTCISKLEIQEIVKENKNIKITFLKPLKEIRRIDLYCNFQILNKIFMYNNVVDITVLNRGRIQNFC